MSHLNFAFAGESCTASIQRLEMIGSPQEFVGNGILRGFLDLPKSDVFGVGCGHALCFEQNVTHVLVAPAAVDQHADVAVDRLDYPEAYLGAAVIQDSEADQGWRGVPPPLREHDLAADQVFARDLGQRFRRRRRKSDRRKASRSKGMLGRRLPVDGGFRTQALLRVFTTV